MDVEQWKVRAAPHVGGRDIRRDFEVFKRGRAIKFTVALPWSDRRPDQREQEQACADLILRFVREIAAQQTLLMSR